MKCCTRPSIITRHHLAKQIDPHKQQVCRAEKARPIMFRQNVYTYVEVFGHMVLVAQSQRQLYRNKVEYQKASSIRRREEELGLVVERHPPPHISHRRVVENLRHLCRADRGLGYGHGEELLWADGAQHVIHLKLHC